MSRIFEEERKEGGRRKRDRKRHEKEDEKRKRQRPRTIQTNILVLM